MKKKPARHADPPASGRGNTSHFVNCHHVPPGDLFFYAQSFHKAAKSLAAAFQPVASLLPESDASPVVFLYRHALELHLKAIILGEGGNFLAPKPDHISVSKSHSISWLAQFVSRIVTVLNWENEFKCEGIESLADFRAVVEEVNSVDPSGYICRSPLKEPSHQTVQEFAHRMDALIELLAATADGLAAEWDMRTDGVEIDGGWDGGGFGPTIQ
jgi:hypothetical protein